MIKNMISQQNVLIDIDSQTFDNNFDLSHFSARFAHFSKEYQRTYIENSPRLHLLLIYRYMNIQFLWISFDFLYLCNKRVCFDQVVHSINPLSPGFF